MGMALSPLRDRRILVVEDEALVGMSLQDALNTVGALVIGPVATVEKAIETIASKPGLDAAIVDVNLGGAMAYPVADALIASNVPFVFTSGYEDGVFHARYPEIRNCHKPYAFETIAEALSAAMAHKKSGCDLLSR